MTRIPHGEIVAEPDRGRIAAGPDLHAVDFLFPDLQADPDNLLPVSPHTPARLKALAATMVDPASGPDPDGNSTIPAAYTYLGQFIDHDITALELRDPAAPAETAGALMEPGLTPMAVDDARAVFRNERSATPELDSVYGLPAVAGTADEPPRDPANRARMLVGPVTKLGNQPPPLSRPPGKEDANDLPRLPPSADEFVDRAARIGDPRNDENTIISQLHVAFLRAHNRLVDDGLDFDDARRTLRRHYQHIVVHDYLPRIADPQIVEGILEHGNQVYDPAGEPYMPLAFAVAGFRFGHTMVRTDYDFNVNFGFAGVTPASLDLLFVFSALSGELGSFETLPENWIIEWENLAGDHVGPGGLARRIDTRLAGSPAFATALFNLQQVDGQPEVGLAAHLSARNLLRGYRLRMPSGQAVARRLGLPVLTTEQLRAATGGAQAQALRNGGFLERTPLWFYVLAEARAHGGDRLGPVGSTLVAEVLIGLVRRSADSILAEPGWAATLPAQRPGRFELADLLRYAGVLDGGEPTLLHVVQPGDTLSTIARAELGNAARWPEIFGLNRRTIAHPDRLTVGQELLLPTGPVRDPQLRFHVVVAGETLAGIAEAQLGDRTRWPEIFRLNADILSSSSPTPPSWRNRWMWASSRRAAGWSSGSPGSRHRGPHLR